MWRATIKALIAQRVRLLMTILAVTIGVAFVAGTFVLTDTMSRAFDSLFETVNRGLAVEVTAVPKFEASGPGGGFGGDPVPESLVGDIRAIEGVRSAEARRMGYVQVLADRPAPEVPQRAPTIGLGWSTDPDLNQFVIETGRAPERSGEIVVVQQQNREGALRAGDRVRLLLQAGTMEAEVVGTAGFGTPASLGVTLIAFDEATAAAVFGGNVSAIDVSARRGVSPAGLRDRIEAILPAGLEARTGSEAAAALSAEVREGLSFLNTALLVFAVIALFVGAFIIFNTFQILVTQRSRELGLLRAIGATPGQVRRSVTAEAALVGVVASAAGIGAGILLAKGLRALTSAFGATLPGSGVVMQPRTVIAAAAVGIGITVLSSIGPAAGAARVPAIAALRDAEPAAWRISDERVLTVVILVCTGAALLELGLFGGYGDGLVMVGLGAAILFVAVAVFAPIIVRPVARFVGAPLRAAGVPGKLGRENSMRNPRRTAVTAASLMIGLGLVATVSIVGESVKASASRALEGSVTADYVVSSTGFTGFSPEVARRLEESSRFSAVVELRRGAFGYDGRARRLGGVDASLRDVLRLDVVAGSPAPGDGEVLVARTTAADNGWQVGDEVPAVFARTGEQRLRIGGIFEDLDVLPPFLVNIETFDLNFTLQEQLDEQVLLRVAGGTSPLAAKAVVDAVAAEFPVVKIEDRDAFRSSQEGEVNRLLGFVTALLGLSVIVALFGIANTLALSVFERTREIGLLRAVGMAPRQVRAMVRWESIIIALLGALLGTGTGAFFGWALVEALAEEGVTELSAPWGQLAVYVALAGLLGVIAAILPARRAARLNVLAAIAYE